MKRQVQAFRDVGRQGADFGRDVARWWLAELAGLVPRAVRRILFGRGRVLTLRLDGGRLDIGGAASLPLDTLQVPPELRAHIGQADIIELVLPASLVLRRMVRIPAAAGRALAAAVPFLVERHTPFLPDRAVYAWRVATGQAAQGRIDVELAVTAAAALDGILARLTRLDLAVSRIHVEGDDCLPALDFAASGGRRPRRRWLAEPWRPLLASALGLALGGPIVVAAVVHARADRVARAVSPQGETPQARELQRAALRDALSRAVILSARSQGPRALDLLQQVTVALPDTSWLFSFDLTPQTLQIGGFSTDMPAAVERLQALPTVEHLEFRSPVIHDARADRDRFDILLRLQKAGHAERVSPQPNGGPAAAGAGGLGSLVGH